MEEATDQTTYYSNPSSLASAPSRDGSGSEREVLDADAEGGANTQDGEARASEPGGNGDGTETLTPAQLQELREAHAQQFPGEVVVFLSPGQDINARDNGGLTLLDRACDRGDLTVITTLIMNGADANMTDRYGWTPLCRACHGENYEVVEAILGSNPGRFKGYRGKWPFIKPDLNMPNEDGRTPLHLACIKGKENMVALLLSYDAKVNTVDTGDITPLEQASMGGHYDIVNILIRYKESWYSPGFVASPLHFAVEGGHFNVVRFFLYTRWEVDPLDTMNETPLHTACALSRVPIAKFLLRHGADVNARNRMGQTPLHLATSVPYCERAMFTLLLENGADINAEDSKGRTPLYNNCCCDRPNSDYMAKLMKTNIVSKLNPIFPLVEKGNIFFVKLLIKRGMNINGKTGKYAQTPLHIACEGNLSGMVKTLLENKADVNAQDARGMTGLHVAAQLTHSSATVKHLLSFGADVKSVDAEQNTPLHVACMHSGWYVVGLLLENYADPNARNRHEITPLQIAVIEKKPGEILELLLQFGAKF